LVASSTLHEDAVGAEEHNGLAGEHLVFLFYVTGLGCKQSLDLIKDFVVQPRICKQVQTLAPNTLAAHAKVKVHGSESVSRDSDTLPSTAQAQQTCMCSNPLHVQSSE